MNKKDTNKRLFGWGSVVNLAWDEEAQNWLHVWGLVGRAYCISGQMEHLQGHERYLNFSLLVWHLGQE